MERPSSSGVGEVLGCMFGFLIDHGSRVVVGVDDVDHGLRPQHMLYCLIECDMTAIIFPISDQHNHPPHRFRIRQRQQFIGGAGDGVEDGGFTTIRHIANCCAQPGEVSCRGLNHSRRLIKSDDQG